MSRGLNEVCGFCGHDLQPRPQPPQLLRRAASPRSTPSKRSVPGVGVEQPQDQLARWSTCRSRTRRRCRRSRPASTVEADVVDGADAVAERLSGRRRRSSGSVIGGRLSGVAVRGTARGTGRVDHRAGRAAAGSRPRRSGGPSLPAGAADEAAARRERAAASRRLAGAGRRAGDGAQRRRAGCPGSGSASSRPGGVRVRGRAEHLARPAPSRRGARRTSRRPRRRRRAATPTSWVTQQQRHVELALQLGEAARGSAPARSRRARWSARRRSAPAGRRRRRWRSPPAGACRRTARAGSSAPRARVGDADHARAARRRAARGPLASARRRVRASTSASWAPIRRSGSSAPVGSCGTSAIARRAARRICALGQRRAARSRRAGRCRPPCAVGPYRPQDRARGHRLAAAGLAEQHQRPPGVSGEARRRGPPRSGPSRYERRGQVGDLEPAGAVTAGDVVLGAAAASLVLTAWPLDARRAGRRRPSPSTLKPTEATKIGQPPARSDRTGRCRCSGAGR